MLAPDPVRVFYGIDFSGNHRMWTPGCRRTNVWIATAEERAGALGLVDLRPVQQLRGREHPFERLVAVLANDDYCAAGIDAPFSLPERHIPTDGWPGLLRDIAALPKDGRPFPTGKKLVAYAERNVRLAEPKPLRRTEKLWSGRGLNVRSTLWDGARGGAAFTIACLTLLERVGASTWPWKRGDRLLVEAFPACQLLEWGLEHRGYASSYPSPEREDIIDRVSARIEIPDGLRKHCCCSPDALDAVLCLFAAKAAAEDRATVGDQAAAATEGWIAVDPN